MTTIEAKILKGFRDFLPEVMIPREEMIQRISGVFERYGFSPLASPALEYSEILLGKYGDEGDRLLYRFKDNGDRDVCLRYDLTVPLARIYAMNKQLEKPFKRYQIAPVWRAENPSKGRFREFVQCDIDTIGSDSPLADAEIIATGIAALTALGLKDFKVRINDRRVLNGLLEVLQISPEQTLNFFRTLDKLDKIGLEATLALFQKELNLNPGQLDQARGFFNLFVTLSLDLFKVESYFEGVAVAQAGIANLKRILRYLTVLGQETFVGLDLSIARGIDYYNATIFETTLEALKGFGSIMSGGRYDHLIGIFQEQPVPAVGISIGMDRLLAALQELHLVRTEKSKTAIFVMVWSEELIEEALVMATRLREAGFNTEVSLSAEKVKKQFSYADNKGIPFALVYGPDEKAASTIKIKDMRSGEQVYLPQSELIQYFQSKI